MNRSLNRSTSAADVSLLELVDRLIGKGVVLSGDITLSVADVDLVYVGLRVLLSSVETAERIRSGLPAADSAGGVLTRPAE